MATWTSMSAPSTWLSGSFRSPSWCSTCGSHTTPSARWTRAAPLHCSSAPRNSTSRALVVSLQPEHGPQQGFRTAWAFALSVDEDCPIAEVHYYICQALQRDSLLFGGQSVRVDIGGSYADHYEISKTIRDAKPPGHVWWTDISNQQPAD